MTEQDDDWREFLKSWRLSDRQALENMRDLRRRLLEQLQSTSGVNPTRSQDALLEDLRMIEDGLERLQLRQ